MMKILSCVVAGYGNFERVSEMYMPDQVLLALLYDDIFSTVVQIIH